MTSVTNSGKPPQTVLANNNLTIVKRMMITIPGIKAVNCADTAGGTESGSLIVMFF